MWHGKTMKNHLLSQRLQALGTVPGLSSDAVDCLARHLTLKPATAIYRFTLRTMDPEGNVPDDALADALITAASMEILIMEWCLVCRECTGIIHSVLRFSGYEGGTILCPFCNKQVAPDFQENVEIIFSPHPSLGFRKPDPFRTIHAYQDYCFSRSFVNGGILRYVASGLLLWYMPVGKGQKTSIPFRPSVGVEYNCFSVDCHQLFRICCSPDAAPASRAEIVFLEEKNEPIPVLVSSVTETLVLTNLTGKRIGVSMLECGEWARFNKVFTEYPISASRRLMGSRILLNPLFIRHFGHQTLTDSFSFQVGRLGILFTDLKGSTALYSRLGDLGAYNLVGRHFDLLEKVVAENRGIVIKTIGDALMAVFHERLDAVRAAVQMHQAVDQDFGPMEAQPLQLKIGIHYGNVLAVNANQRLDYFGQAVNVAARVQNEAGGGEICLSDSVLDDYCPAFLTESGWQGTVSRLQLKGLGEETPVYRYRWTKG